MNADQLINLMDRMSEVWKQFIDAVQQYVNSITDISERIHKEAEKRFRQVFLYCYKKNDYLKKLSPICRIERKHQKHLPYQRRDY